MNTDNLSTKLYNIGLSYKKADVKVRGEFSITKENQKKLLLDAKKRGIEGVFVLSTCNRTEITGFAQHPFQLISLLIKYSNGNIDDFIKVSNVFKNKAAVRHLFNIGTGLESQILGDYEIVSQLKESFNMARELDTLNAYLERLINLVLQASKDVKNNTKISSGTTSVSYAAVQYIIDNVEDYNQKNIVVYGLGDIGKNTCKNLLGYTQIADIILINRTFNKAQQFALENPKVKVNTFDKLIDEVQKADILIVSTGANVPTITTEHLNNDKEMLILDLSMPENVDARVKEQANKTLVNLDELSVITDKTLEIRKNEVPLAEEIINKYREEFNEWIASRKFVPAVNALKESLKAIQFDEIDYHKKKYKDFDVDQAELITSRIIQKITTQFVKHLKEEDTSIDQSISIISKVFNTEELILEEYDY